MGINQGDPWMAQNNGLRLTRFAAITKSQSFTLRQPAGNSELRILGAPA
jgi:hypothetical protein